MQVPKCSKKKDNKYYYVLSYESVSIYSCVISEAEVQIHILLFWFWKWDMKGNATPPK
jgi:hypothetical protein